jgi:hypothetical protein
LVQPAGGARLEGNPCSLPCGDLAVRAVLCGRYETRADAVAAIEAEVARSTPSGYEKEGDRWWISDKEGKFHWLSIEGALA